MIAEEHMFKQKKNSILSFIKNLISFEKYKYDYFDMEQHIHTLKNLDFLVDFKLTSKFNTQYTQCSYNITII